MSDNWVHDQDLQRFRVKLEPGYEAVVLYQLVDGVAYVTSTRVPDELQGKGYGKVMMEAVLPEFERLNWKIVPKCSYVRHYLERLEKWQHLVF